MRREQWESAVERMVALWPGRRKLPEATVEAWYDELGKWADAEIFLNVLTRLGSTTEKAPGLATLIQAVKDAGGDPRRRRTEDDGRESPEDRERWDRLGADWILINRCRYDEGVRNLLLGLMVNDADPGDMRLALLEEIRERKVEPREPEPLERGGELAPIGEALAV